MTNEHESRDSVVSKVLSDLSLKRGTNPMLTVDQCLGVIDPSIKPLVLAMDSDLTLPIYSCGGHYEKKSEPAVYFLILPGCMHAFEELLHEILHHCPLECIEMQISHRHRPVRFGKGPFIDWKISIFVGEFFKLRADDFEDRKNRRIIQCARFLAEMLPGSSYKCP